MLTAAKMPNENYVTRLAPSPTGALHLGNARTFLVAWLRARSRRGRIILRIENLDHPKVKNETIAEIYADLRWLGLDWDEGDDLSPPGESAPYTQSKRLPFYRAALRKLFAAGFLYPCVCSRADIVNSQLAPHAGDELLYPNICRERKLSEENIPTSAAWRFIAPNGEREFVDNFCGIQRADLQKFSGDFVVARGGLPPDFADTRPAYQLACVVDDAAMAVSEVIRADDLLPSVFRQLALYSALDLRPPEFLHLPLLIGKDGKRLAKRHGDTRLSAFREHGWTAAAVVGKLAFISNLRPDDSPIAAKNLIADFDLKKIPHQPAVIDFSV